MPNEQIDFFRPTESDKHELSHKIAEVIQQAAGRISGPISGGHFEAMLESALLHDANLVLNEQARSALHQAVESAGGFWKKVDLSGLADTIASEISRGT